MYVSAQCLDAGHGRGLTYRRAIRRAFASAKTLLRGRKRRDDRGSNGVRFEGSPGQFGNGATRDLTASEIAALRPSYSPVIDGDPDPGEVIWTWVPFVENDGRGKDRPVLVIARVDATRYAACYLSTKQHDGFVPVGTGGWDSQGRESFLAPDRILSVSANGMRREGTLLAQERFIHAISVVAKRHGFPFR